MDPTEEVHPALSYWLETNPVSETSCLEYRTIDEVQKHNRGNTGIGTQWVNGTHVSSEAPRSPKQLYIIL